MKREHKDILTWGLISVGTIFVGILTWHIGERIISPVYSVIDPALDRLLGTTQTHIESTNDAALNT